MKCLLHVASYTHTLATYR